ncbi:uncharacterized protein MISP3 [Eublepharis macularius]|uniref:Uncharacterized protein MISP3 n=1 Tax=Eublepharis macularius TaxID=481883 RepID=A0AA97KM76_EUBMA|nr:uncharacterized protein MISP3 [Eublepharis macularius]
MDMTKDVALTTSQGDSSVLPFDGAPPSSLALDGAAQDPFTSVRNDGHFDENSLTPLMSSETFKVTGDEAQNCGHSDLQSKTPDPSLEQLKAGHTSSLSVPKEESSHLACQDETPEASSEEPNPAETSEKITDGEEGRPHKHRDTCPTATAGSPKHPEPSETPSELGQGERGSPFVHYRDTSEFFPEQQKSDSSTWIQLVVGEESQMNCHGQSPGVASQLPEQPEGARDPKETVCSAENSQDPFGPKSAYLSLPEANSPKQPWEGGRFVSPDHPPSCISSADPQETLDPANISEGQKPGGQEMTGTGEREKVAAGQEHQPIDSGNNLGDPNRQSLEETPADNSQTSQQRVAQDQEHSAASPFQALALTDPQSGIGTCCQQRAAGTGCDTFPKAVPPLSPVATRSLGPASEGPAPGCDEQGREGPNAPESLAAGSNSEPLGEAGAKAVLGSERGEEKNKDTGPEHTIREPEGAQDPKILESVICTSPEDPYDAMVLACTKDSLDTRDQEDSQDLSSTQYLVSTPEQAGSSAKPRAILLIHSKEPANTEELVNATDPICTTHASDELSAARCPMDWMENDTGNPENRCPTTETPIEREIRLHLEREELLRQERGLTSPRGAQEYVEVRIRPILNPSVPPSLLPKEKERQWAGAQMQREIQRECQREEDLVQLGKVRGAYDRGMQQELQEKKMIFEQHSNIDPLPPTKMVPGSSEGMRERSFDEADSVTGTVMLASGVLPQLQQPLLERPPTANPFFCLRAKNSQSLLEREVQEARERERELQRQRHKLYGSALPQQPEETSDQDEEAPFQAEKPPCKKLDVTWPPPSPSETCQVNGLHQLERSPRSRQKSPLIQRWESGTVGNQESQD